MFFTPLLRQLHVSTRLGLLAVLSLLAVVTSSGVGLWAAGRLATLSGTVNQTKDVVADILPPPLYLIEMRLVLSQTLEGTMSAEQAQGEIKRLAGEHDAREAYWKQHPIDGLDGALLEAQYGAAHRFMRAAAHLIDLAASGTAGALGDEVKAVNLLYLEHRAAVDRTVAVASRLADNSMSELNVVIDTSCVLLWVTLGVTSLGSALCFFLVMRSILLPLGLSIKAVRRVAEGDLSQEVIVQGRDEFNVHSGLAFTMTDDVGVTQGTIAAGGTTDDNRPTLSGTLTAALGGAEELAVYDTVNGVATKLGLATVTGTSWTYTPAALADGNHSLQAVVQATGNSQIAQGEVISPASAIVVATSAATQTATITGVTDNASINGSIGSALAPAAVASGSSTDDTTPTLAGTVSAALGAGLVVGVYDTVGGVTTKLGNANVTGTNWTYTPTAQSAGSHSFTAKVENPDGGSGASSNAWAVQVHTGLAATVSVDSGPGQSSLVRYVMLANPAPGAWDPAELRVWSNGVNVAQGATVTIGSQGTLTGGYEAPNLVDGNTSTFYHSNAAAALPTYMWVQVDLGAYYSVSQIDLVARSTNISREGGVGVYASASDIMSSLGLAVGGTMTTANYTSLVGGAGGATLVGTHDGSVQTNSWGTAKPALTDNTPTLSGTLTAAVGAGEEVAVYDTFNGTAAKLGVATLSGLAWTFTPGTALADGTHRLQAVVQAQNNSVLAQAVLIGIPDTIAIGTAAPTQLTTITTVTDDAGGNGSIGSTSSPATVVSGSSTDDITPTINGTLSAVLGAGQQLVIYDTVGGMTTKLGSLAPTTTNWSFTPTTSLAAGVHSFTAKVENPGTAQVGTVSAAYGVNVQSLGAFTITDDVGAITGNQWQANTDGTARYVRVQASYNMPALSEVQVWAWVGGVLTNVAAGKNVSAAYPALAGTSLGSLVDDSTASAVALDRYSASGSNLWLQIDLGQNYVIQSIVLASGSNAAGFVVTSVNDMRQTNWVQSADPTYRSASFTFAGTTTIGWTTTVPTDDTAPALSGTLSTALGAGEVLAIWDGSYRLGTATVTGTDWSYNATLAAGSHSLVAKVENASGQVLAATVATTLNIDGTTPTQGVAINSVTTTQSGAVSAYALANGGLTDGHPTLSGVVGTPSLTTNEKVAIYDGSTRLGYATVSGSSWSFMVEPGQISAGTHSLTAVVENTATGAHGTASAAFSVDVQRISVSSVTDDVGAWTGNVLPRSLSYADSSGAVLANTSGGTSVTDDTTPTFAGTLGHALGGNQVLVGYDGAIKLGNATVSGTSWSYTPTALTTGSHSVTFQIEDTSNAGVSLLKTVAHPVSVVASNAEFGTSTDLSINNAGMVDLTAVSNTVQQPLNHVTLGSAGVSGITLQLDSTDVALGAVAQYSSTTGVTVGADGRHQVLIDGTTSTANTVNVTDSSWTNAGTTTIGGKTYVVFNHDTTTQLLIDSMLTRHGGVI